MSAGHGPIKAGRHTCAVDGCPEQVPSFVLMCRHHWRLLPKRLRDGVDAAWQDRLADPNPATIDIHQRATAAAQRFVEAKVHHREARLPIEEEPT